MTEPHVISLGCRLNAFESEVMREQARAAGLTNAVIVNTCAVTGEAGRQARQTIRRARRDFPDARLIVTGCAAQLDPEGFGAMPEVDRVLGNADKLDPARYLPDDAAGRIHVTDLATVETTAGHLIQGFEGRSRAFVQVQQGCDHRCTFCIIPFARGPNRSVGLGRIVEQVRVLVAAGYQEIVLTGVDISSYGADLPGRTGLGQMVERLLEAVPELPRLRLGSLDPAVVDDDLLRVLADQPRLMGHLHLSIQAMDDMVLKRMKRRHDRDAVIRLVEKARAARPDVVFGADLIAGFPTETEAMFEASLNAVDELGLTHLHVFPYSVRTGTPAARMPAVPKAERKRRASALRQAGERALARMMASRVGETESLLIETNRNGLTEHYLPAVVDGAGDLPPGAIVRMRVGGVTEGRLQGRLEA